MVNCEVFLLAIPVHVIVPSTVLQLFVLIRDHNKP